MNFSCENKGMASQVKKNKNQFIRKGIATSAVINTPQDVNTVDVSTIQSGVEKVQIGTPDVNSGVQSGVERVQIGTPDVNSGVQSGVERVQIGTPDVNSGVQSGVERVPIDIPNVNSGEINGSLRSIQKEEKLYTSYEQTATNSCTEVGGRSVMPEENFDPGGIMYNQYSSEYVPKLHSESCSKPSTGGISQSAIKNFSGQQTYDHVYNNHAPPLPKTPPPELPAKPPRMAKDETWGQHSSPANREVNQRSPALKKHHSSRLQKEYSPQFSNNLDDDGEENEDVIWEYPGEKKLTGHQMMASDIKYPKFKEHSQMHYGGEGILDNVKQGDQSSKAGHMLGGQYGQQTGQIPCGHLGGQMPGVLYMGNMGNMHQFGRNSGYTPSWQEEGYSGQLQDGQHSGPVPTRHFAGTMKPVPTGHLAGTVEPVPTRNLAGTMGPVPTKHYAGSMRPGPNRNHAGTIGQMPYQLNEGSMQQMHESSVGQMHGSSVGQMYGGSLGPLHGNYVGQMHGGLHGGSVGQMHPHAQSEVMHPFGQGYLEEFQDVHHEQDDMGQPWDFPKETWQGDGKGNASYSQHASNFPGPSTYMTDRELASGQLDQRMNNPWFQKVVQNMKELVEREGLIVKDVFPDGNCLFTAVVDQLRVRGNFNFTPSTLRAAAVAFLRENPKQHDGTHLEQFLMNESWDHYLGRMCKDGEWGEHIILGAMSEVLKCRIIVLGGMSGNSRTVVQPQRMYDEEEKKMQKEKEEANGSKTVKDESLAGTAKSEVTGAESQSLQTGAASSTSKADAKTKGTDTSHRKVKTSSLSKQNKTKKDEELQMGEDLYIGLVGEMHYVSLRKKDWEERLNEKLRARIQKRKAKQRQEAGQRDDSLSDDDLCLPEEYSTEVLNTGNIWDPLGGMPIPHLNFLVEMIESCIIMLPENTVFTFPDTAIDGADVEIVGVDTILLEPHPMQTAPYSSVTKALMSRNSSNLKKHITVFKTPNDTRVHVNSKRELKDVDLIIDPTMCNHGFVRLMPVTPDLWPCSKEGNGSKFCLPHLTLSEERDSVKSFVNTKDSTVVINSCIAFKGLWPEEAIEWVVRERTHGWPAAKVRQQIIQNGCRFIPIGSKTPGSKLEWKLDFSLSEDILLRTAVSFVRKIAYRIWKMLLGDVSSCYQEQVNEVTRSVFFYACETIPIASWKKDIGRCILYMIKDLLLKLENKTVPHYFVRSFNLMDRLPADCALHLTRKVQIVGGHPLISAYFCLDSLGVSYDGNSNLINIMFEDLRLVIRDGDVCRSYRNVFLPVRFQSVRTFAELMAYPCAAELCMSSFIFYTEVDPDVTFPEFYLFILTDIHMILKWCIGFYFDLCQGMLLLDALSNITETVSLSTIVGPITALNAMSLRVPVECTQGINVLFCVDHFSYCLERLALHKEIVAVLCTFIRKYYIDSEKRYFFDGCMKGTIQETVPYPKHQNTTWEELINCKLYVIYSRLFFAYCFIRRHGEFECYMNLFEEICDRYHNESAYIFLAHLWRFYQNQDKADIAITKSQSLKK